MSVASFVLVGVTLAVDPEVSTIDAGSRDAGVDSNEVVRFESPLSASRNSNFVRRLKWSCNKSTDAFFDQAIGAFVSLSGKSTRCTVDVDGAKSLGIAVDPSEIAISSKETPLMQANCTWSMKCPVRIETVSVHLATRLDFVSPSHNPVSGRIYIPSAADRLPDQTWVGSPGKISLDKVYKAEVDRQRSSLGFIPNDLSRFSSVDSFRVGDLDERSEIGSEGGPTTYVEQTIQARPSVIQLLGWRETNTKKCAALSSAQEKAVDEFLTHNKLLLGVELTALRDGTLKQLPIDFNLMVNLPAGRILLRANQCPIVEKEPVKPFVSAPASIWAGELLVGEDVRRPRTFQGKTVQKWGWNLDFRTTLADGTLIYLPGFRGVSTTGLLSKAEFENSQFRPDFIERALGWPEPQSGTDLGCGVSYAPHASRFAWLDASLTELAESKATNSMPAPLAVELLVGPSACSLGLRARGVGVAILLEHGLLKARLDMIAAGAVSTDTREVLRKASILADAVIAITDSTLCSGNDPRNILSCSDQLLTAAWAERVHARVKKQPKKAAEIAFLAWTSSALNNKELSSRVIDHIKSNQRLLELATGDDRLGLPSVTW